MTMVRRNIGSLGTAAKPWHPTVLGYAKAIQAMQALPESDVRSWVYQAAIHGRAGVTPPPGAPWNECQHATWYFLPWHRMYLFQFERIVRSFVVAAGGPGDWTLPYWDYSSGPPTNVLPPAFRAQKLPDGSANPLFVARRRATVNAGQPLPAAVVDTSVALGKTAFTSQGAAVGFGGPQTGWAHQGPAFGALEAQPHGPVHVQVGGSSGLMTDPDLAALDPIFWLHHANIDRLWDLWRLQHSAHVNPALAAWLGRRFTLRDVGGGLVRTFVRDVVDAVAQLDYTYDSLPAQLAVDDHREAGPMPKRTEPKMIGRSTDPIQLTSAGAATDVAVGPIPEARASAAAGAEQRLYLNLADIEGTRNPGVVFGVYLNPPEGAKARSRDDHLAGVVSFFGIEQAGAAGTTPTGREAHPIRYSFDVTDLVARLQARGNWDPQRMRVVLAPIEGSEAEDAGAAVAEPIRVGTVSLFSG